MLVVMSNDSISGVFYSTNSRTEYENKGFSIIMILGFLGPLVVHDQPKFYNSELHPKPNFLF